MAEILVKSGVQINAYEPGDIIVVREDGFKWGKSELDTALFNIVKFPGVPASSMTNYIEPLKKITIPQALSIEQLTNVVGDLFVNAPEISQRKYKIVNNQIVNKEL